MALRSSKNSTLGNPSKDGGRDVADWIEALRGEGLSGEVIRDRICESIEPKRQLGQSDSKPQKQDVPKNDPNSQKNTAKHTTKNPDSEDCSTPNLGSEDQEVEECQPSLFEDEEIFAGAIY